MAENSKIGKTKMRIHRTVLFLLLVINTSVLADIQVTTRFNPPRIAMGDRAQYLVEIVESDSSSQPQVERVTTLPIPQSGGLELRNGRTSSSQQTRIINGAAEYSVTQSLIIDASAPSTGKFTIPGYRFEYKGQLLEAKPATLEVLERSADAGPTQEEMLFLKADLPEELYVGQTTQINLELYIAEGVRLNGLNSFDRTADGFTISELPDDSQENSKIFNGRRYRVLIWPLSITPIQTGPQNISFQFALTAQLPGQNNSRDSFGRSPFGRSIFDDFFGRSERLNIYTDAAAINVLPLPGGQPESFSGAIGNFSMEVSTDADSSAQGEPIMLSMVIQGSGNFDRIEGPSFKNTPDWKHYAPETQFESSDSETLSGRKRFDYVFIPQRAGRLELPETKFSYLNPTTGEYEELSAPAISVDVAPAQNTFAPPPAVTTEQANESQLELSRTLTAEEALLTLDYRPEKGQAIGLAVLKSPTFITLHTLAGLSVVIAAIALSRNRRDREDPTFPIRSEAKRRVKEAQAATERDVSQNDADAFFSAGQSAIRNAATAKTGKLMQSANSEEVSALLPESLQADCHAFFEAANAIRFGGNGNTDLAKSKAQLANILKAL